MTGHRLLPLLNSLIGVFIWAVLTWAAGAGYGALGMAIASPPRPWRRPMRR
jgi:hypothetical protein